MIKASISARLKELRERAGVSQERCAQAIGKSLGGYQHYENPNRTADYLPMRVAEPLAKLFDQHGGSGEEVLALAGAPTDTSLALITRGVEVVKWKGKQKDRRARAAAAFTKGQPHWQPWIIRGRALTLSGIMQGDIVIVDHQMTTPEPGEVVIAQSYDWDAGETRSVIRIYEPPYLIAASQEQQYRKPILIDHDKVRITGTVIGTLRLNAHDTDDAEAIAD